jgi:hypothetical protein
MRPLKIPCPSCKVVKQLHYYDAPRGKKKSHFACKDCVDKIDGAELGDPLPTQVFHVTGTNPTGVRRADVVAGRRK